jgi:hypothetical protein
MATCSDAMATLLPPGRAQNASQMKDQVLLWQMLPLLVTPSSNSLATFFPTQEIPSEDDLLPISEGTR